MKSKNNSAPRKCTITEPQFRLKDNSDWDNWHPDEGEESEDEMDSIEDLIKDFSEQD